MNEFNDVLNYISESIDSGFITDTTTTDEISMVYNNIIAYGSNIFDDLDKEPIKNKALWISSIDERYISRFFNTDVDISFDIGENDLLMILKEYGAKILMISKNDEDNGFVTKSVVRIPSNANIPNAPLLLFYDRNSTETMGLSLKNRSYISDRDIVMIMPSSSEYRMVTKAGDII